MKEYIEREAAIKEIAKWLADVFGIKSESGAGTLFKKLRSIPAADVVEVVRCKNCACWNSEDPCDGEKLPGYCQLVNHQTKPTYYCGYGVQYENPVHT